MRMHKCHSESNLSSIEYAQSKFVDSSDNFGEIGHLKKRLAAQHVQNAQSFIQRDSGYGEKVASKLPRRTIPSQSSYASSSTDTVDRWAIPAAFVSARSLELHSEHHVSSCFANAMGPEVDSSSDHSDSDRFEAPLEERATLSRIGSQLTLALPDSMGIRERKRLLSTLSERVDAHEGIILHHGAAITLEPVQSPYSTWRRSFSSTTAELQDLEHQEESRRSFEDEARKRLETASSCRPAACQDSCSKHVQGAELCMRLNHARQTVSFVQSQAAKYSTLEKGELNVWQALDLIDELTECDTTFLEARDTDADLRLKEHSFQIAEACRLAYPEQDWLHLVGLIHDLGRLLRIKGFGSEPTWAVCGESFPVGCRFDPSISYHHYFSVNPDRRRRQYNTETGLYSPGGGLSRVLMSWSAPEYLYMVLLLNQTNLPAEALFLIRYQKFWALNTSKSYKSLMSEEDLKCLSWLTPFRELSVHKRKILPQRLQGKAFYDYYNTLIEKYIPGGTLHF